MPKQPRAVLENVFAFPPNRDTLGGTAYLIVENDGNILIDAPPWIAEIQDFLAERGGVRTIFLTHRDNRGKATQIQNDTGCTLVVQEQEAYLLPDADVKTFQDEIAILPNLTGIWTPGYSPGSSCAYYANAGGVLFSGRHLLPNREGMARPQQTFHWRRQLRSVKTLRDRFSPETLALLCPGSNTGFLRGKRAVENAYEVLANFKFDEYSHHPSLP